MLLLVAMAMESRADVLDQLGSDVNKDGLNMDVLKYLDGLLESFSFGKTIYVEKKTFI